MESFVTEKSSKIVDVSSICCFCDNEPKKKPSRILSMKPKIVEIFEHSADLALTTVVRADAKV